MKITKSQLKQIIKEELKTVLAEQAEIETTERTLRDRDLNVVNAWGAYMMSGKDRESLNKLIKVLKSFYIPKETAFKIIKAETSQEVLKILNEGPRPGERG